MSLEDIIGDIKDQLNSFLHSDWLGSLLIIIVVLAVTAACSRILHTFLDRILRSDKGSIPQASIFINIGRFIIWAIGICVILSSCFGINVQAAVTALGIGGIAISLGFQSTLSNLFGGLQIVLGGIIEPGDRIKISTYEGIVRDVTWRHTSVVTPAGETVIVPNSLINSSALQKLHPQKDIRLALKIDPSRTAAKEFENAHQDVAETVFGELTALQQPRAAQTSETPGQNHESALQQSPAPYPSNGSPAASASSTVSSQQSTQKTVSSLIDSDDADSLADAVYMLMPQDRYGIDAVAEMLEGVVDQVAQPLASIKQGASVEITGRDASGYKALLSIVVNEGVNEDAFTKEIEASMKGIATIIEGDTVTPDDDLQGTSLKDSLLAGFKKSSRKDGDESDGG